MSPSLTLFFRAEYILVISDCGRRRAEISGTRPELIMGSMDRLLVKGIALCATASTGGGF